MDPTARAATLTAVLVVAIGLARPRPASVLEDQGVHPTRFWAEKAADVSRYDVVLAGDSRVFRGLAPSVIAQELGGARVTNAGFSGACLCGAYLDHVVARLDRTSARRTLVLGVTPHALTAHAERDNGYLAEARRTRSERLERVWLAPALDFVAPIAPADLVRAARREPPRGSRYVQRHEPDGWVASALLPPEPDRALGEYRRVLTGSAVEPRLVAALADRVRGLAADGTRVVAFRPPASPALRRLEEELGRFDEPATRAALESAGARWVDVDPERYPTYDGSHLDEASARALSRDLARDLAGAPPRSGERSPPR